LSYNPTSAAVIVKYLWDKYKGFIPQGKTEPIDTSNYQDAALSLITHAEYFIGVNRLFNEVADILLSSNPEPPYRMGSLDVSQRSLRLKRAMAFDDFCIANGTAPVATTQDLSRFYLRSNRTLAALERTIGCLEQLQLPNIDAAIGEVVELRLGEESFAVFRDGLANLIETLAPSLAQMDYGSAASALSEAANRTLEPAVEALERIQNRSGAISKLIPLGARFIVGICLRASLAEPISSVASPVAAKASGRGFRRQAREFESSRIAKGIAFSMMSGA
jgi:hypothetical protein